MIRLWSELVGEVVFLKADLRLLICLKELLAVWS